MDDKLRAAMEPLVEQLLAKRSPEVITRASVKLEASITRTRVMMRGRKGRTGPVGDPAACDRMRNIVMGKEVKGASPVEYSYVKTKWDEAVEDILKEEAI